MDSRNALLLSRGGFSRAAYAPLHTPLHVTVGQTAPSTPSPNAARMLLLGLLGAATALVWATYWASTKVE